MPIILLSSTLAPPGLVTLADIERAVAARCGPFERYPVAAVGTTTTLTVAGLSSTIDIGGYADLWLLRRGVLATGAPIVGFAVGDRQRRVVGLAATSAGLLTVDRAYATAPAAGEEIELMVLDPAQQLRPAVLAGLRRCFFVDRVAVVVTDPAAERNLSVYLPWITDPRQVWEVAWWTDGLPVPSGWSRAVLAGTEVQLGVSPDRAPSTMLVTALRPHSSWVNMTTSPGGPTLDGDVLSVDLAFAAAAGTVEAWRTARPLLAGPARAGQIDALSVATAEFNEQRAIHVPLPPDRLRWPSPGGDGGCGATWG